LPHRLETSGRAIHVEIDGLDIGGQHGSMVCSSSPHSQAADAAISHLYKQKGERPTPVGRREGRSRGMAAGVGD